jgi:hypothetical protein
MSNYSFKIIKNQDDYLHFILHSCKGGNHNNCVVTIDHKEQSATIYWPSSNGINQHEYFTGSQDIGNSQRITNPIILAILKNKLYVEFMEDGKWKKTIDDLYMNMIDRCRASIDSEINYYFRKLDEWYVEVNEFTKTPRYIWRKTIDNKLFIDYTDFESVNYAKYVLTYINLEIKDNSTLNYEGIEIYGEHPMIEYFDYKTIKNKFPEQLWKSDFIPKGFHKSKNIIIIDSRSIEEVELIIKTIFNKFCEDVTKSIC